MIKIAVYLLQIYALVPEIFKFEKCVIYANERTVMPYTQLNITSSRDHTAEITETC